MLRMVDLEGSRSAAGQQPYPDCCSQGHSAAGSREGTDQGSEGKGERKVKMYGKKRDSEFPRSEGLGQRRELGRSRGGRSRTG